ncbi:MAG: FIST N-terminal domain-containing protein, partial [Massilia sp.]
MAFTQVAVGHTALRDAQEAGAFLAAAVNSQLGGAQPDLLILFASPDFSYRDLLAALSAGCAPRLMVGCSSAGEFSGCATDNSSASVMAIRADDILFNAALGTGLRADRAAAMRQLTPVFSGASNTAFPYRSALVLTDALAGYADELVHELTVHTGGTYQLFGGGAADDARFQQTHVFYGTDVHDDAVVVV